MPSALHGFGSYDWHSCVHMHWSLARLLNLDPEATHSRAIVSWFDRQFDEGKARRKQPISTATVQRTGSALWLGWLLLKLYAEIAVCGHPHATRWRATHSLRWPIACRMRCSSTCRQRRRQCATVRINTSFGMIHALRFAHGGR